MSDSLRACLADALNQGIVVIERPEDHTMPPGQQVLWNTEKQTMRALVSRFNHVLRRLVLLSGWNEDTLNEQLAIFGQFYGYGGLLDGVHHQGDGAIVPGPLIDNLFAEHSVALMPDAQVRLCNALQDLLFFNLSSARSLDASDRRALMSITSDITVRLVQESNNVA